MRDSKSRAQRTGSWRACGLGHIAALLAVGAVAAVLSGGAAAPAAAQTLQQQNGHRDLLRPLYANSMDIEEGKRIAQHFCADCHGPAGISSIAEVPDLAGQRAAYLYSEMRAYLSGSRGDDTMNGAITYLSTDAMSNVAAYYASLAPAEPRPDGKSGEVDAVQAGKAAAAACAACHGESGISATPGVPNLVGQEPKYLVTALGQYKDGTRKDEMMKAMATPLTAAVANNIALYYALQKPARAATPAQGDVVAGQAASAPCGACHGATGVSGNPATPSLAGQDAKYVAAVLHEYKDGKRKSTTMGALSAALDDTTIRNLAAFYAGLQPQQPSVRKPLSTAEWVERCDRCHGVEGNSNDPLMPSIAAQRAGYLEKVLNRYRSGSRHSSVMSAMMDGMSENDVRNLAAYYASRKAHAVVYVPVPSR